jgi:hypothetical protein
METPPHRAESELSAVPAALSPHAGRGTPRAGQPAAKSKREAPPDYLISSAIRSTIGLGVA